jgi:hypothetical protein
MATPHFIYHGLSRDELARLGELTLTWSNMDHSIGQAVRLILKLTDEQFVAFVGPLATDRRMQLLKKYSSNLPDELRSMIDELNLVIKPTLIARNTYVHAVVVDGWNIPKFKLMSKDRVLTKEDLLGSEPISNYAGLLALHIEIKLEKKFDISLLPPLPSRPYIPPALLPEGQRGPSSQNQPPSPQPQSSRE